MTDQNHLYATNQEIEWLEENKFLPSTLIIKRNEYDAKLTGDNGTVRLVNHMLNKSGPNKIDPTAQF